MRKQELTKEEKARNRFYRDSIACLILILIGGPFGLFGGIFTTSMDWKITTWILITTSIGCLISGIVLYAKVLGFLDKAHKL